MRVRVRVDFRDRVTDGLLHQGITAGQDYFVYGLDDRFLRIVNDKGEPILYPKELFEFLDQTIPAGWMFRDYADGEYYLDPIAVASPGFFEDWHGSDGDPVAQSNARKVFRETLEGTLAAATDEEDKRLVQRDLGRLPQGS